MSIALRSCVALSVVGPNPLPIPRSSSHLLLTSGLSCEDTVDECLGAVNQLQHVGTGLHHTSVSGLNTSFTTSRNDTPLPRVVRQSSVFHLPNESLVDPLFYR